MQLLQTDSWKPRQGTNELLDAAKSSFTEVVATLLGYGVNPILISKTNGEIAITIASHHGHEEIVDLLLAVDNLELEKMIRTGRDSDRNPERCIRGQRRKRKDRGFMRGERRTNGA